MNRRRGYTLIELVVTLAIVAVLASVALPLSEVAVQRGKEQELRRALLEMRDALNAYRRASDEGRVAQSAEGSGYPPTLAALVKGVADAKSPTAAKIYFLRRCLRIRCIRTRPSRRSTPGGFAATRARPRTRAPGATCSTCTRSAPG